MLQNRGGVPCRERVCGLWCSSWVPSRGTGIRVNIVAPSYRLPVS